MQSDFELALLPVFFAFVVVQGFQVAAYVKREGLGRFTPAAFTALLALGTYFYGYLGIPRAGFHLWSDIYLGSIPTLLYVSLIYSAFYAFNDGGLRKARRMMMVGVSASAAAVLIDLLFWLNDPTTALPQLASTTVGLYIAFALTLSLYAWLSHRLNSKRWSVLLSLFSGLILADILFIPTSDAPDADLAWILGGRAIDLAFFTFLFAVPNPAAIPVATGMTDPDPRDDDPNWHPSLRDAIAYVLFLDYAGSAGEFVADNLSSLGDSIRRDELTGLGNRRAFDDKLDEMLEGTGELHHGEFAVLWVDAAHFERVDDLLGPDIAESIIGSMADHIRETVGPRGWAYRTGETSFAVLLPDMRGEQGSEHARRIERFSFGHPALDEPVSLTAELVLYPESAEALRGEGEREKEGETLNWRR